MYLKFRKGCVLPAWQQYVFQLPTPGVMRVGPHVNKYEQVSSDDHQMPVADGGGVVVPRSHDHGRRDKVPRSHVPTRPLVNRQICLRRGEGGN